MTCFMLAKTGNLDVLKDGRYIFEPKLDGTRAMFIKKNDEIQLINRRGYNIKRRYPEFNFENCLNCESCILDGEIIVYNSQGLPDFHLLQMRELVDSHTDIMLRSKLYPATYVVFDILEFNGENLRNLTLLKRKLYLKKCVKDCERLQNIPYMEKGEKLWKMVKDLNLEGVMAKKKESKYVCARSENWLKIKYFKTVDAVIVGYTPGQGKREKTFGALLLALYNGDDLQFIGKVGTGFDDDTSNYLLSKFKEGEVSVVNPPDYKVVWVKPEIVCEVQYLEVTQDEKLRAPSFKKLRMDKEPKECTIDTLHL